ncbi:helix-turn-helix transcriptional regulator [Amycolatopsis rubida]|uniref:Helix-turn-helix transcriptional regulator n=1 Tax=Amycolatopsis rubida TaxID=112413 RepID=A0ABX0C4E3_9PSEU|nr:MULTISPECIES: TetR/AcrR family transcriptional regulator [Amycolatopsis]MYW97655.1 TetR family transcriptional regulator [Amycolatopsis rubida]NEC62640.1 helix-turn-helix transcriptional regulator [Amycolatopsis rubida]OAP21826.1 putative HTH-type transcriptional regulator TtgW [Amycolatopsis sp. M39]
MATTGASLETPKRMTRRRAETRRRVMAAAYEVFAETGIRDAPVELICDRAGFTRGAFYSNFASKEELFLAIYEVEMRERAERLRGAVEEAVDRAASGPVDEVLREAGLLFMESLAADETWYLLNAEFRAQALRQPDLRAPAAAAERRFHEALADILRNLLDRLDMRLTVDPRSAVVTVVALYETMLERAILDELPDKADSRYLTDVLPRLLTALTTAGR